MKLKKKTLSQITEWRNLYGNKAHAIEEQLAELVKQYQQRMSVNKFDFTKINGTTFSKEYKGIKHTVVKTEEGFLYNEKLYKSLSAIANSITGTHCNGKRFFGVT